MRRRTRVWERCRLTDRAWVYLYVPYAARLTMADLLCSRFVVRASLCVQRVCGWCGSATYNNKRLFYAFICIYFISSSCCSFFILPHDSVLVLFFLLFRFVFSSHFSCIDALLYIHYIILKYTHTHAAYNIRTAQRDPIVSQSNSFVRLLGRPIDLVRMLYSHIHTWFFKKLKAGIRFWLFFLSAFLYVCACFICDCSDFLFFFFFTSFLVRFDDQIYRICWMRRGRERQIDHHQHHQHHPEMLHVLRQKGIFCAVEILVYHVLLQASV